MKLNKAERCSLYACFLHESIIGNFPTILKNRLRKNFNLEMIKFETIFNKLTK